MRFRVFGFPTQVEMSFWITAILFGWMWGGGQPHLIAIWVVVVFVSILFHELGHAFAMQRYGMSPFIKLHMMGGLAGARSSPSLTRLQRISISFAGPLAGFVFGGMVYVMTLVVPSLRQLTPNATMAELAVAATIQALLFVNIGWGLVNLVPVLPLDGGHIFEAVLGPGNQRRAVIFSIVFGATIAVGSYVFRDAVSAYIHADGRYVAIMFGMLAFQNFRRLAATKAIKPIMPVAGTARKHPAEPKATPSAAAPVLPPELAPKLKAAHAAMDAEHYDEAGTIADLLLTDGDLPAVARIEALHIVGWAHLLETRPEQARRVLSAISREGAEPDAALSAGTMLALGETANARSIAEAARRRGDHRKEVVSTLIQALIQQGEVARAAAIALDIADGLSDDDLGQMASLAFDHRCYPWASRLSEALFQRTNNPDHAYDAACSRALEGDQQGSLQLLQQAVAAGFNDAARAWSDKALDALRRGEAAEELAALLPPPVTSE